MTEISSNFSPIKQYYSGKSILITGVTGLVGKVLLYKILKSIDTIDKVYVVIREKKNLNASQRLSHLVEGSKGLFVDIDASVWEKVVVVNASLTTVGLNLSVNDRNEIIENVSIVFHSAADVAYYSMLKEQMLINVGGTKEMIDLCGQLKHFDALVYVSTAYSSPLAMVASETVYSSERNPLEILEIARNESAMNSNDYLGEYPNTYFYTKNLSENLIKDVYERSNGDFPVTIVRPGIVLNSILEPKIGWFNSITSIMGMFVMLETGLAKTLNTRKNVTFDVIPVDTVANACIASAARQTCVDNNRKLLVYNCNSSCLGAIKFEELLDILKELVLEYPLLYTLRPCNYVLTDDSLLCNAFTRFVIETCFAYLIDALLALFGKNIDAVRKLQLFHAMNKAVQPYIGRQCYFTNDNMIELSQQLSECDRNTFDCDIQSIEWRKYFRDSFFETRKLLLKEKEGDIERAQRNIK